MKGSSFAKLAIALWLVTVAVFAWFFVRGNTVAGEDNRTAIVLAAGERALILSEMRALLAGRYSILDGINHKDVKQIASAARAVGMASAADVNPALMAKLPMTFKTLGMSVHQAMDDLAIAADGGKSGPELQTMLTEALSKCVACHTLWQIRS
jgi:hypothetical protein